MTGDEFIARSAGAKQHEESAYSLLIESEVLRNLSAMFKAKVLSSKFS